MHRWVPLILPLLIAGCASKPAVLTPTVPTNVPSISPSELRSDLFAFAADSFWGREAGTSNESRAARFIADRLARLGLEPAGDSLFYQRVPLVKETFAPATRIEVTSGQNPVSLGLGVDVVPWLNLGTGAPLPKHNASGELFFAGYGLVSNGRNDFRGIKAPGHVIVILHGAPPNVSDSATREELESQLELGHRIGRALQFQPAAVVILTTGKTSEFYRQMVPYLTRSVVPAPGDQTMSDAQRPLPMVVLGLAKAGSPLVPSHWPNDDAPQVLTGRMFSGHIVVQKTPVTSYNVVGVVRGTDPRLNKTYVALGAHHDHIGVQSGASPDSIANGADDDGSGTVTLLAMAKALMSSRPRRSVLLVWHGAEEKGLLGSAHFTKHPTVPIDSIVAQINSDMIGRRGGGSAAFDSRISGSASENRLFVIGPQAAPNNQSRALGVIFDTINTRQQRPLDIDRTLDAPDHPERYYERSDHYNYAQKGIPVLMLSTGFHEDYHKVSDEPNKIDFEKMTRIGTLMLDLTTALANRENRPR